MLLEELFYKAIGRSHARQSEQSVDGEMILRRLRDLQSTPEAENDPADDSGEGSIQNTPSSVLESKMIRTHSTWQEACAAALSQSDERKLLARVGSAIDALQMRFAEWGEDPGSDEELTAILASIRQMDQLLSEHPWNEYSER